MKLNYNSRQLPYWEIFSIDHITLVVLTILPLVMAYFLCKRIKPEKQKSFEIIICALLLMRHLTSCILTIYTGMWNWYEYLPIHLCDISVVLCAVTLITKSQLLFEYTLYLGMPGAITAIATPVFIHGSENLFVVDYYIAHLGILFCAMYSIFILKMQPRKLSWLKIYLLGIIVIFIPVTVVNLFLDTNYIYTMAPPYIGHPLTFGPWPYYLIGYHFTAIVSNLVIYYSFNIKKSKSKIENLEMSK